MHQVPFSKSTVFIDYHYLVTGPFVVAFQCLKGVPNAGLGLQEHTRDLFTKFDILGATALPFPLDNA